MTDDTVTGDDVAAGWVIREMPVARLNAMRGRQTDPPRGVPDDMHRRLVEEYAAAREFSEDEELSCDSNGGA